MAKDVFIPKLGQTMEEATLIRWLAEDGAKVEHGQEILEVETDKAIFSVEALASGHLHRGPYDEGDVLPVLTVVGIIGKPDDRFEPATEEAMRPAEEVVKPTEAPTPKRRAAAPGTTVPTDGAPKTSDRTLRRDSGRVFASPRARKLAAEKGVDLVEVTPTGSGGRRVIESDVLAYLSELPKATPVAQRLATEAGVDLRTVSGTGPGGRITREDVEQVIAATAVPAPPPPPALPEVEVLERVPLKGVRGIIAQRMGASAQTTARVTMGIEVDATEFVALRDRLKARVAEVWGFAPGYNDLLAKVVATALRQFPYMNARLTTDSIEYLAHVNLGIAVDTDRGLLVPVIRDADRKSLRQLGTEFRELVERARPGKALPDDLSGGTFTITNLGMFDIDFFTPIINLPEAAILGVGRIVPKAVPHEDEIVVRQMWTLSLAFDHRITDGAPAARFLQYIKDLIEEPYLLLVNVVGPT
ncbi:MAG: 2-oxo acid dehydrogenase subunit E2 [Anaerolineae bacterium]